MKLSVDVELLEELVDAHRQWAGSFHPDEQQEWLDTTEKLRARIERAKAKQAGNQ